MALIHFKTTYRMNKRSHAYGANPSNGLLMMRNCECEMLRSRCAGLFEHSLVPYEIIRIYHECEDGIEKSVPRITDWYDEACHLMTTGDREGPIFLSHPHKNNGFFFLLTSILEKLGKDIQKILNMLRCELMMPF